MRKRTKASNILFSAAIYGGLAGFAWSRLPSSLFMSAEERQRIEQSVTYSGCDEVRALGRDPIRSGEPGYRSTMDGDSDGLACEPYR